MHTSRDFYINRGISVAEYSYTEDMNKSHRPSMEDGIRIYLDFIIEDNIQPNCILFGILDGHGG